METAVQPVLTVHGMYPIYLHEDWSSGIGGGLWTTGLAIAHYFTTDHCWRQILHLMKARRQIKQEQQQQQRQQHRRRPRRRCQTDDEKTDNKHVLRVLELGSGNGFLSVCLILSIKSHLERRQLLGRHVNDDGKEDDGGDDDDNDDNDNNDNDVRPIHELQIVVTDTAEHLSLIQNTIGMNLKRSGLATSMSSNGHDGASATPTAKEDHFRPVVTVQQYLWGESTDRLLSCSSNSDDDDEHDSFDSFDMIIGSDLAYRDELHDPLIDAMTKATTSSTTSSATKSTMILLGVTMSDTKPIFFRKLHDAGFRYERLADHLIEPQFRGQQFGIFVIWKDHN